MTKETISIQVHRELFRFSSKQDWIDRAREAFRLSGHRSSDTLCVDKLGRVVTCGADFTQAQRDEAYPVVVYLVRDEAPNPELIAAGRKAEARDQSLERILDKGGA